MPKKKKSLSSALAKKRKNPLKRDEPLWKGPEVDGVTQSMLSAFLVDRERFRIKVIEGIRVAEDFNHRIEYGNMWHLCEEQLAKDKSTKGKLDAHALLEYVKKLCHRYPLQQEQILHWYNVCKTQFPIYVQYWKKQREASTSLMQEEVFDVPYELPSGRVVKLRGMMDGVSLRGPKRSQRLYLDEHKTKADIKEEQIKRQLSFDLQTMVYLVALRIIRGTSQKGKTDWKKPIGGVYYNVVKRPLSGGKGSIRRHKPTKNKSQGESTEEFYARLGGIIAEFPEEFFMRWQVEVTESDIEKFQRETLDPLLETVCQWYDHVTTAKDIWSGDLHYRTPFGIYNVLAEGGSTDIDNYLLTGDTVGLEAVSYLFRELVE